MAAARAVVGQAVPGFDPKIETQPLTDGQVARVVPAKDIVTLPWKFQWAALYCHDTDPPGAMAAVVVSVIVAVTPAAIVRLVVVLETPASDDNVMVSAADDELWTVHVIVVPAGMVTVDVLVKVILSYVWLTNVSTKRLSGTRMRQTRARARPQWRWEASTERPGPPCVG